MKHIKTNSGFEAEIDENILNDMELLDEMIEMEDGGPKALITMSKIATKMLGKEQKGVLYDHLRTEDGRVPLDAFSAEVKEILEGLGGKN